MKRKFCSSLFSVLAILVIFGCSKDKKEEAPSSAVVGFWVGEYTRSNSIGSYYYAVLFRNDGTVREFRGDPIGGGTDTSTSIKYQGTYLFSSPGVIYTTTRIGSTEQVSISGTILDPLEKHMEGTWGIGTNTSNQGSFIVNKK